MDKHKLSEILQALPDSFSFTAVLEEAIKEKEGVSEQSQEQIQAQTLQDQIAEAYLESKEQELWEDMQDTERWWRWAVSTGDLFYDLVSKQWVDSDSYWGARIKEQLESSGIFMSEDEFASMLDLIHSMYLSSWGYTLCAMDLQDFYYHYLDCYIADYLCLKNKRSEQ